MVKLEDGKRISIEWNSWKLEKKKSLITSFHAYNILIDSIQMLFRVRLKLADKTKSIYQISYELSLENRKFIKS